MVKKSIVCDVWHESVMAFVVNYIPRRYCPINILLNFARNVVQLITLWAIRCGYINSFNHFLFPFFVVFDIFSNFLMYLANPPSLLISAFSTSHRCLILPLFDYILLNSIKMSRNIIISKRLKSLRNKNSLKITFI